MLQKLVKIKNYLTLQATSLKINIFIPKLYRLNLINFLLITYSNLKNNIIKITNSEWPLTFSYHLYMYIIIFYTGIEVVCWAIL